MTAHGLRRARLLWVVLALPMLGGCWWHGHRGEGRGDRHDERWQERREERDEHERHSDRDERR